MIGAKGVGGSGCSKIYRRDAALTYPLSSTLTLLSNQPKQARAQRFSHLAASSPPLLSVFSCAPCGEVPHPPAISFEQKSAKKLSRADLGKTATPRAEHQSDAGITTIASKTVIPKQQLQWRFGADSNNIKAMSCLQNQKVRRFKCSHCDYTSTRQMIQLEHPYLKRFSSLKV